MQPEPTNPQPVTPGWEYKPDSADKPPTPAATSPAAPEFAQTPQPKPTVEKDGITWSASEFIAHQKNFGWYVLLGLAGLAAAAVIYLLTHDIFSTAMVILVVIVLAIFAARKPRTLDYQVDSAGVHIGKKSYAYDEFKSFSVIDEGPFSSITFMPLKRFMPGISVFYEPDDEKQIVEVLSGYLPIEEGRKDAVDRFMHKIRF
ncbi:MAG: hypothetical protein ABIQ89_01530 [Candidatus Saccharimonadales bacterium]